MELFARLFEDLLLFVYHCFDRVVIHGYLSGLSRQRLEYWTLVLGPKFCKRERAAMNLRRFYAFSQIEYCRNFIFKRHFPIPTRSSSAVARSGSGG